MKPLLLCLLIPLVLMHTESTAKNNAQTVVPLLARYALVTKSKNNLITVKRLSKGKLRVTFELLRLPDLNNGYERGIASLNGDTAIFTSNPSASDEPCKIRMIFNGDKLEVTETGDCGWGYGVSSSGTYLKVRPRAKGGRKL